MLREYQEAVSTFETHQMHISILYNQIIVASSERLWSL
jgi:hypothetical protein